MVARYMVAALCCLTVAGCSSSSGLTTGSLFGGSAKKTAAVGAPTAPVVPTVPVVPVVTHTPMTRALHVGAYSARAVRCGFHFDAAKLKSDFMAAEVGTGISVEDTANLGKAYSTGFNGVAKGITNAQTYCTSKKVATIKVAITRYLSGDYTPPAQRKVVKKESGGIFGGLFDGDVVDEKGPKWGSGDWWDGQNEKAGG